MRGLPDDLRDRVRAWAEETAQAQGLGPTVLEGDVLRSVVVLLEGRSGAPLRQDAGLVEQVVAPPAGLDHDVVDDGGDDLLLAS